jgi:hypothetical protein
MQQIFKLILTLALCGLLSADYLRAESNVTASTCVCTTVTCPVAGTNVLTEGVQISVFLIGCIYLFFNRWRLNWDLHLCHT